MEKPDEDMKKMLDTLGEIIAGEGDEQKQRILAMMKRGIEENKDEIIMLNTEFEVDRPVDNENESFICLKDILEAGFKTPEYDSEGYSEYRPVFNTETPTIKKGEYNMVSSAKSFMPSRLYSRYIDEPCIIFRERDKQVLFLGLK